MKRVIDSRLVNGSLFTLLNERWYFGLHSSGTSPSLIPGDFLVHSSVFIRNFRLIWQRDLKVVPGGAGEEAESMEENPWLQATWNRKEMMMNGQWVFMSHSEPSSLHGVGSERASMLDRQCLEGHEAEPSHSRNEDGEDSLSPAFPPWWLRSSADFFRSWARN